MTRVISTRGFWRAVAAWGIATTAFTVALTEATIAPLADDATIASAARIIAYLMGALTVVGMLAVAMGFALVTSSTLRWIEVETDFRAVLATLWPAVTVMAAFSAGGAVLIWLSPMPTTLPGTLEDWERLRDTITNQFPLRQISLARPWARGGAVASVVVTIKRRLGCDWLDAGIGVGAAVAVLLVLSAGSRILL